MPQVRVLLLDANLGVHHYNSEPMGIEMTDDASERHLGFEKAVRECFHFLEESLGFRCSDMSPLGVRYESDKVFIDVFHGMKDYEIGVQFGLIGSTKQYSFLMFVRRFFPGQEAELGELIADTHDSVSVAVTNLAKLFRAVGQPILNGDPVMLAEMDKVRWWHFRPEALR